MSMSTLGQQLAAINAPGTNTGSTFSTSRRHEDAIGRGVTHSVQVGHAMRNKSHLYKPSIIYQDAKKASDVPLATIRENCVASLRQLEAMDPEFGVFVTLLCKPNEKERGLLTSAENETIDTTIEDLLFRLSLRMSNRNGNSNNNTLAACLHVVEYLLRKYDIHLRPKTASTMILVMLPHHEEPYFLRILQLIDLANLPEWSFLRPFAVPGARVGRSELAAQASKDVAMVRSLGRLSQRNIRLPCSQHSLSFTAAVLVEALTLQTHRKGTVDERTLQTLLPFVVTACRNKKPKNLEGGVAWQNWGLVLASTIVETSVLAPEPQKLLVTSVLHGLTQQRQAFTKAMKKKSSAAFVQNRDSLSLLLSNGMIVALTILSQEPLPLSGADSKVTIEESRLPILSSLIPSNASFTSNAYCGCSMDKDILAALLKLDESESGDGNTCSSDNVLTSGDSIVAHCLGSLYGKEGLVDFKSWIAAILVTSWRRILKQGKQNKEKSVSLSNRRRPLNLILALIQQADLEPLWKKSNGQWIESYTSFVLLNTPCCSVDADQQHGNEENSQMEIFHLSAAKAILKVLRRLDTVAYERGLTHALIHSKTKEDRTNLVNWMGLLRLPADIQLTDDIEMNDEENSKEAPMSISLPPRVALEHAESKIRLDAIPVLLAEAKDERNTEVDGGGETILQSFLRRFLVDDDANVALASAEALEDLLSFANSHSVNAIDSVELGEGSLEGLLKWASSTNLDEITRFGLVVHACRFASRAAKALFTSKQNQMTLLRLLEALGAFMSNKEAQIAEEAAKGIIFAWDRPAETRRDESIAVAKSLLISDEKILREYRRAFRKNDSSEIYIRRQLVGVLLDAFATHLSSSNVFNEEAIEYCIWLVDAFSDNLRSCADTQLISECLLGTAEYLASTPENIVPVFSRLASADKIVFKNAFAPYIEAVCKNVKDKKGYKVSPAAVVMEALLALDNRDQIENVASVARDLTTTDQIGSFYSFIPTIALTCHSNENVRGLAVDLLCSLSSTLSGNQRNEEWTTLTEVCCYFANNKSSVVLGGQTCLPGALASVLSTSSEKETIRKCLLEGILCSAAAYGLADSVSTKDRFKNRWLDVGQVFGGYRSAALLLDALESAGEEHFPLLSRWHLAGKPLLKGFHSLAQSKANVDGSFSQLVVAVIRMLKGVRLSELNSQGATSKSTIITSGPASRGGRSRSYSFGKNEGVKYLSPYPRDMSDSIVSILNETTDSPLHKEIMISLYEIILSSASWRQEIFSRLDSATRQKIALGVLSAASGVLMNNADVILSSLPLEACDVAKLLVSKRMTEDELSKVTFVSDYIITNSSSLASDPAIDGLFGSIFKQLASLPKAREYDESVGFARQALLSALLELINNVLEKGDRHLELDREKKFDSWMNSLVDVLVGNGNSDYHLVSPRLKRTIFYILASFCDRFPAAVVPKLIPIIIGVMPPLSTSVAGSDGLAACLELAIPVYFKHSAKADLSPSDLFNGFIDHVSRYDTYSRVLLYQNFVGGLTKVIQDKNDMISPVGAFVAAVLAREMSSAPGDDPPTSDLPELSTRILSETGIQTRISAIWTIQCYAKDILFSVLQEENVKTGNLLYSVEDLSRIVCGPNSDATEESQKLCQVFIVAICDAVANAELRNVVKQSEGSSFETVLRMWQDLLLIQSTCNSHLGGFKSHEKHSFLESIVEVSGQALDWIQGYLPSHIFLAFVTSLMQDGETEELRSRAVQLIADRAASLDPRKPEAILFADMIPPLMELIKTTSSDASRLLKHSVFAAVETIGRSICLSSTTSREVSHNVDAFSDVVSFIASTIEKESNMIAGSFADITSSSRQLVGTGALCASTAIKICGPRAIPALTKLFKSLFEFLELANTFIKMTSRRDDNEVDWKEVNQARLMQLSFLRTFKALVEKLPLFLKPFLAQLLKVVSQIPETLRLESDNHSSLVETEMGQLQRAMTSYIPARHLVPAASESISLISDYSSILFTLKILTESVKASKTSEIVVQLNLILQSAFTLCDQHAGLVDSNALMNAAKDLVLALVLKLSEVQLRSLYGKFREWRRELDHNSERSKQRSLAFWEMSSTLSKHLKTIFLPCLTTVFADAVQELEDASSFLCKKDAIRTADGKKRQKIDSELEIRTLKSLLLCLEFSLRSDAYNGGAWIREAESQRYEMLLRPLGKLLQCRLPCSLGSAEMSFESVVQGKTSDSGCVIGCLVALASAAGDEQLWKPLNHSVLQACANETRSEVRKAGVSCLLSLIKSIGEEYMVLIPECLPVLSELLEDSDEEIAGLAQDCISHSEELLGESLQDSLR